ncbi:putative diguanylate cyclase YcdT [Shimia sp. SK013]|uniref:GGDEF domain-containing protein n=1 Tax=Shimia sp. SK013 TaxID=1389006 RepID=UPI0006CD74A2|nr:GGDEF domain-containing protein [Shimia sp. SK013]KPA22445.1 putative diguanylate cyclase YcdT [Shimia sp. SK013]
MIRTSRDRNLFVISWTMLSVAMSYGISFPLLGIPRDANIVAAAILCPLIIAPIVAIWTGNMMLRLHETSLQLRAAAERDHLTGIYNRQFLVGQLGSISGAQKAVVLMADIDHFKRINDTYGHIAGDRVITYVAQNLTENCRDGDAVARFGGEEFAVVMIGASLEHGLSSAERMRQAVADADLVIDGRHVPVTISVGVAVRHDSQDANDVLHAADTALYEAKENGRNRVQLAA